MIRRREAEAAAVNAAMNALRLEVKMLEDEGQSAHDQAEKSKVAQRQAALARLVVASARLVVAGARSPVTVSAWAPVLAIAAEIWRSRLVARWALTVARCLWSVVMLARVVPAATCV